MVDFERGLSLKPSREFAEELIAGLKDALGVDILPILNDGALSYSQMRYQAARALLQAAVARGLEGPDSAEWGPPGANDEESILAPFTDGEVDIEPNVAFQQKNVKVLTDMQGQDVKDFIYSLTKRFENASKSSSAAQLALELTGGAVVSVGLPMGAGVVKAFRAGQKLLAAVRAGVLSIGLKTAIAAVVVVLIGFLLWLFFENPKKCLGLVINDTEDDLFVNDWRKGVNGGDDSDLYMNAGATRSFMEDYLQGDLTKKVQIKGRVPIDDEDKEFLVWSGVYFADKKPGAFGAEGVMIFSTAERRGLFAHMFAVPFSKDNGTNMVYGIGHVPQKDLFEGLYRNREVRRDLMITAENTRLVATMNDARGGTIGCIAAIIKPAK
jgi:hypothetical protein